MFTMGGMEKWTYVRMMDEKPENPDLTGCVLLDEKIVQQFHF